MGGSTERAKSRHALTASSSRLDALLARLEGRLDQNAVLTGADVGDRYLSDATQVLGHRPPMVLRPKDTAGVSAILAECDSLSIPLVVQGGRTGLSGGARPLAGEIAMSLERMSAIEAVDEQTATAIVQAGATLQSVQDAASHHNLMFGVDIGARGTATIGGNIATNAGGIRVLRYGMLRAQVLGVEAVLADGSVLTSLKGLPKDNSGFDLNQIFIGSEGTLGVVTRASLRLHPKPAYQANAFCALPSLDAAIQLLGRLRGALGSSLSAFEVIFPDVYAGILTVSGGQAPVPAGAGMYVLVEMQGQDEAVEHDRFAAELMTSYDDGLVSDVTVSGSLREYNAIWALRDAASEFIFSMDHVAGFDISLPLSAMSSFLKSASQEIAAVDPAAAIYVFGHLGDGNLHYMVRTHRYQTVADLTFACVARMGGAVSAEHGIGLDKKKWLPWVRSAAEMAAMRRLKSAFDPNNILNPGRVFDMLPGHRMEHA